MRKKLIHFQIFAVPRSFLFCIFQACQDFTTCRKKKEINAFEVITSRYGLFGGERGRKILPAWEIKKSFKFKRPYWINHMSPGKPIPENWNKIIEVYDKQLLDGEAFLWLLSDKSLFQSRKWLMLPESAPVSATSVESQ